MANKIRQGSGQPRMFRPRRLGRVDVQVSILAGAVAILSCFLIFFVSYRLTYQDMIAGLVERVESIHSYVETFLEVETFGEIDDPEDMDTPLYLRAHDAFYRTKVSTGVAYLYTAKRTQDGRFVYVIDGLDPSAADFRRPGDAIEPEIIPELERALAGEEVWPAGIKDTGWGKIFIAYLPIHSQGEVVGVVGVEFEAESQYNTYHNLRLLTPIITLGACLLACAISVALFRRISNPSYRDLANTDRLTGLKSRNAYEVDRNNLETRRLQQGVGLCLIDLNNLKRVNDTLGHHAGDEYLQCAARVIGQLSPRGAAVYRIGGDEFLVLTHGQTLEQLEAWSKKVSAAFLKARPQWEMALSLSVGCALFDAQRDGSLEDTYRRADRLMYCQKRDYHHRSDL